MALRLAEVKRLPLEPARMSDGDLARALAAGSPTAPALVWDRYAGLVRGILRRSLGPGADVDDRVQESFMRFFGSLKNLRDPDGLRSFLIGVAVRVVKTEIRRRRVRRWLWLSDTGQVPEPEGAELDDEAREALERLYAILDDLGAEARIAFVLRHVEGLELEQVAAAPGVSLATAKRRLAKARAVVMARVAGDPLLAGYGADGAEEER